MVAKRALKAVKCTDKQQVRRRKTIAQAVKAGDDRELLVALRDRLARQLDRANVAPTALVNLVNQFRSVTFAIEQIDARARREAEMAGQEDDDEDWPGA